MKADIHPQFFENAEVSCACGNTFTTGLTVEKIQVDVCNRCHPFFTGEMKYVDTLGRVEKFEKGREKAKTLREQKKKQEEQKEQVKRPQSLREMIALAKKQASS